MSSSNVTYTIDGTVSKKHLDALQEIVLVDEMPNLEAVFDEHGYDWEGDGLIDHLWNDTYKKQYLNDDEIHPSYIEEASYQIDEIYGDSNNVRVSIEFYSDSSSTGIYIDKESFLERIEEYREIDGSSLWMWSIHQNMFRGGERSADESGTNIGIL